MAKFTRSYLEHVDFEKIKKRFDYFWQREILDRPVISIRAPKEKNKIIINPDCSSFTDLTRPPTLEELMDIIYKYFENTVFIGDAIPKCWPDPLGPDSFTAYLGADLNFSVERSTPCAQHFMEDISLYNPVFSTDNKWWKETMYVMDEICREAKDKFLVGIPDMHGGGDSLVAAGGATQLSMNLYDKPEHIKRVMNKLTEIYYRVYNAYYEKISAVQQGTISWIPAYSRGKFSVLQNDFSGLISPEMFKEFFLQEDIVNLSRFLDNSFYHLDGAIALGNLDYILDVKELNGVQWVPGAGAKPMSEWLDVCSRILNKGKCLQIDCLPEEVELLLENLKWEGLLLCTSCKSVEEGERLLKKVERMKKNH
jgi:hypothetical protein